MATIEVDNVSFAYRDEPEHLIIKDLNATIEDGDFVSLIGQSGCGKSTLLRLIAGLETPTEGEIRIGGERVVGASLQRSVVFQNYGMFPWMSAGKNIMLALGQRYPKKRKSELKSLAMEAMRQVGLPDETFDKFPKALSGGMRQRCAIARSFSIEPPFLLMDEPFGALDAVTRAKLQDLVLELWNRDEKRKTVVFVTHDVDEALLLSNKVFVLGQSPSNIIFKGCIKPEDKPTRETLFRNEEIMELREKLIECINADVARRVG